MLPRIKVSIGKRSCTWTECRSVGRVLFMLVMIVLAGIELWAVLGWLMRDWWLLLRGTPRVSLSPGVDIRVAKAFGTRPYNQVRISVVSTSRSPPVNGFFDYSEPFMYRWGDFNLHSALKEVDPGTPTIFDIGQELSLRIPPQGAGVAGVFIADPCVNSPTGKGWSPCPYGVFHNTIERTPALINAFVGHEDTDFWGILGDNFYDRTGEITWDVFRRISTAVKSKIFMTVPGNHDYWAYGKPEISTVVDQCGNGHMQYYAQDTKAAERLTLGSSASPFNFSVDPSADRPLGILGCNVPAVENSFWYNQVGNVGIVGQSGVYSLEESHSLMAEACSWLGTQEGIELGILVGHWDVEGTGASNEMAMPQWFVQMTRLPGCSEFYAKDRLKFFTGHTHCNDPHPWHANEGFRVAGFGMEGCGNYGVPILDTTNERIRIWYFDTSSVELYDAVMNCVKPRGWRRCTRMATLWLDQTLDNANTSRQQEGMFI